QAEDGIRDDLVTGVQTCALPISDVVDEIAHYKRTYLIDHVEFFDLTTIVDRRWILAFTERLIEAKLGITWTMPSGTRSEALDARSEERRVGKGCGEREGRAVWKT